MSLQRTVGCDGLVMFLGCLWTGYPNLPWDVLQLERGKEAGQEPPGGEQWWKSWRRWDLHGAKRWPKLKTGLSGDVWLRPYTRDGEIEWVSSGGSREGVGGPPSLFSDQTEARGGEKIFFETGSPPLSQGQDDRPPPPSSSEGLICHWWMSQ